ncbi:MAG: hypothetical protein HY897_09220 [Deltaproteobacteria bacterium]|nr:hypothetical protein [Deltaproteobacteria bacterium]
MKTGKRYARALALVLLAWPAAGHALDIDMYTYEAPAKPNVVLFVDDTRPLLRRAYNGLAADYVDCYKNVGACPAGCNGKCPFLYLGLQTGNINFGVGDCNLNNQPLKSLYPSAYFQATTNAPAGPCVISLLNPGDDPGWASNPISIPYNNYNQPDEIDQFNYLTSTVYSVLQALLSKAGNAGQVGLMLNSNMGNDYRYGLSVFNDWIGRDGDGACILYVNANNGIKDSSTTDCTSPAQWDNGTDKRVTAACELDRIFLDEAGLNKLPKEWRPYSEAGVEMWEYFHGVYPIYCIKPAAVYPTPWGNGDATNIQYDLANQSQVAVNAFTLMLALGAPSREDAYADSNGDNATVDSVVTYPNGGTHWLDDVMLNTYRYDGIPDPEQVYINAGFPDATWKAGFARKCQYLGWANNPPPPFGDGAARSILDRQVNCTRQTAATDVISFEYYNPLFELTAAQAGGRYWPVWIDPNIVPAPTNVQMNEIVGYDCTALAGPPTPAPNAACWTGLSKGIVTYLSTVWNRNVNINRAYAIPTPIADIDRYHSFDCGANRYIVSSFVPTQGARFEGHLKAYPFGDQGTDALACPLPVIQTVANDVLEDSTPQYSSGGMLNSNNVAWDAAWMLLSSTYQRRVFTSTVAGGVYTRRDFTDDANITPALLNLSSATSGLPYALSENAKRDKVQEVVMQGTFSYWEGGSRLTSWVLGDIYHSQPVVVGRPNPYYSDINITDLNMNVYTSDPAYGNFVDNQKNRTKLVVAGANDGSLHAFYGGRCMPEPLTPGQCKYTPTADDGKEVWAYVPNALLTSVKYNVPGWSLADAQWAAGEAMTSSIVNRPFGVDGSPAVADVWINQDLVNPPVKDCNMGDLYNVCEWKTYLAGGLGLGGKGVYFLDIGEVGATFAGRVDPKVVSEFTYGNVGFKQSEYLGYTTSDPIIGKVKVCNNDLSCNAGSQRELWVAMFGGGYAPESDPTDVNDSYDAAAKGGRAFIVVNLRTGNKVFEFNQADDAAMEFALAAPPKALDSNGDAYIDAVYVGDLGGQLWRFDMSQYGGTNADITPFNSTAQVKKCDPANLADTNCWRGQRLFAAPQPVQKGNPKPCSFRNCKNCVGCGGALACNTKVGKLRCAKNCAVCNAVAWTPFWTAPAVAKNTFGQVYLFVGTGDRTNIMSYLAPPAGTPERLYGMRDALRGAPTDPANPALCENGDGTCAAPAFPRLNEVVAANSPFFESGWFRKLPQGEKVLSPAAAAGFNVFFTVFSPLSNAATWVQERQYLGDAKLYATDFMSGGSPDIQTAKQTPANFWQGFKIGRDVPSAPKIVARPSDYSNPASPKDAQTSIVIHTGAGEVQQIRSPGSASGRSGLLPPVSRVIYWRETM